MLSPVLLNVLRQVCDLQPTTPNEVAARFIDMSQSEAEESFLKLEQMNMIHAENTRFYTTYQGEGVVIDS